MPSWLKSRQILLISIFVDFIIFFYFFTYKSTFLLEIESIISFIIPTYIVWLISNYIFGSYSEKIKSYSTFKIKNNFQRLINYFFIIITNIIFIYFYLNILNNEIYLFNKEIIFSLIYTVSIRSIIIFFIGIFIFKNKSKKLNILFISESKFFENFTNNLLPSEMKYNFKNINIAQIKTFKGYDFDQIIVENRSILKDEKFLKIFNRNIIFRKKSTFTCLEWSEKYLQRFLPELLDKDLLINDLYNFDDKFFSMRIKRVGDILLSIILLVTTLPILLLSILIIFIQDKGPILYSQTRIGRDGKEFRIYKLRSMVINSETMGAQWSKSNDKRITKFGKIIRIFRIDELPQLGSVIAGDMSLIGPRPERPEIIKTLEKEIPFYNFRNALRPGISGWAQVNYPYGASIKDSKNKLSFDLYYLNNFNILLDFLIFFKTIKVVFRAIGAIPK